MIQFTQQELINLREKGRKHPQIIAKIKEEVKEMMVQSSKVPSQ